MLFENDLVNICLCQKLSFGRLGASIFVPGGPFWHLVVTLETMGEARRTQGGLEPDFHSLSVNSAPKFESFLGTEARNSGFFSGLFPGHFLNRSLIRNLDTWGS